MDKFIEVHGTVINTKDIRRIEFISDDIYLGLLPQVDGKIIVDFVPFTFSTIHTFDGEIFNLGIDLFAPQDEETEEHWKKKNMVYINMTMTNIYEVINPIKVTEKEYDD